MKTDVEQARRPFFHSMEREMALRFHAAELVGTPFAPHAMVPGAGIDCVHVNAWCYLKTGVLKMFEPPRYSLDSGQHTTESALIKWLEEHKEFERVDGSRESAGDTICFNMGLSEHHVGLMLDARRFIHVLPRPGKAVIISSVEEAYYSRRVTAVYRPVEGID